jgi:hypothetical protein
MPVNENGEENTRIFLAKLNEMLCDFVQDSTDRKKKVLHFKFPEDMKASLDLDLANHPVNLQQLLSDCHSTLKNQVKTGQCKIKNYLQLSTKDF